MATNITIFPVDHVVVIYYQDGTAETVEPQTTKSFQLVENGFCTISETVSAEEGEHPPDAGKIFAGKMVKWWQQFWDAAKSAMHEVNPL